MTTDAGDLRTLRGAVVYAIDAMEEAGIRHNCDYCKADAAHLQRELGKTADEDSMGAAWERAAAFADARATKPIQPQPEDR